MIEFSEREGAFVGRRLPEGDPVAVVTGILAEACASPDLSTNAYLDLVRGSMAADDPTR